MPYFECASGKRLPSHGLAERKFTGNSRQRDALPPRFLLPQLEMALVISLVARKEIRLDTLLADLPRLAVVKLKISAPVRLGFRVEIGCEDNRAPMFAAELAEFALGWLRQEQVGNEDAQRSGAPGNLGEGKLRRFAFEWRK